MLVSIGKLRIHSSTAHQIHTAIQEEAYREFFVRKHKITFVYDSIHWEAFSSAFGKTTHQEKTMLTKFIHGWLPTGARKFLTMKETSEFPHCKAFENTEHLLLCWAVATIIGDLLKFLLHEKQPNDFKI